MHAFSRVTVQNFIDLEEFWTVILKYPMFSRSLHPKSMEAKEEELKIAG